MTNDNCVFCKIANGEISRENKIWENENYLAFLDMNPINPGHTLVIPKKHDDYIFDLNDREYSELMLKSKEIAKILKSKLKPKRIGVVVEGFGVPHVHVHLIPINKAKELNPEKAVNWNMDELNKMRDRILN